VLQDHKDRLGHRVLKDHKGVPGSLEPLGHREPQVFKAQQDRKVHKVLKDHLDSQAQQDRRVLLAFKDQLEKSVLKVHRGHPVSRE
jgi:hypothetical protein